MRLLLISCRSQVSCDVFSKIINHLVKLTLFNNMILQMRKHVSSHLEGFFIFTLKNYWAVQVAIWSLKILKGKLFSSCGKFCLVARDLSWLLFFIIYQISRSFEERFILIFPRIFHPCWWRLLWKLRKTKHWKHSKEKIY